MTRINFISGKQYKGIDGYFALTPSNEFVLTFESVIYSHDDEYFQVFFYFSYCVEDRNETIGLTPLDLSYLVLEEVGDG